MNTRLCSQLPPPCRYLAESQQQRIMFRGTFATQRAGGAVANALDLHVKNTSNTNVVCWGGRLLTLFEAGQPYRLDPHTLETRGLETLGGRLAPGLPLDMGFAAANAAFSGMVRSTHEKLGNASFMPPELFNAGAGTGLGEACTCQHWGWHCCKTERLILRCICRQPAVPGACRGEAMTAHPHVDSNTGRLISFSYRVGPSIRTPFLGTSLTFYEFTAGQLSSISSPPAMHPVCWLVVGTLQQGGDCAAAPAIAADFEVAAVKAFELAGFAFLHDFAVTENWYVVFQNPVTGEVVWVGRALQQGWRCYGRHGSRSSDIHKQCLLNRPHANWYALAGPLLQLTTRRMSRARLRPQPACGGCQTHPPCCTSFPARAGWMHR